MHTHTYIHTYLQINAWYSCIYNCVYLHLYTQTHTHTHTHTPHTHTHTHTGGFWMPTCFQSIIASPWGFQGSYECDKTGCFFWTRALFWWGSFAKETLLLHWACACMMRMRMFGWWGYLKRVISHVWMSDSTRMNEAAIHSHAAQACMNRCNTLQHAGIHNRDLDAAVPPERAHQHNTKTPK